MTRKEGILKNWEQKNPGKMLRAVDSEKLLAFEYNNYQELCDACYEQPVKYQNWIEQTIKPVKS